MVPMDWSAVVDVHCGEDGKEAGACDVAEIGGTLQEISYSERQLEPSIKDQEGALAAEHQITERHTTSTDSSTGDEP